MPRESSWGPELPRRAFPCSQSHRLGQEHFSDSSRCSALTLAPLGALADSPPERASHSKVAKSSSTTHAGSGLDFGKVCLFYKSCSCFGFFINKGKIIYQDNTSQTDTMYVSESHHTDLPKEKNDQTRFL